MGIYFHHSGRSPRDARLVTDVVTRNLRWVDALERDPAAGPVWPLPVKGTLLDHLMIQISESALKQLIFEEAARRWAVGNGEAIGLILVCSGWIKDVRRTIEWDVFDKIVRMEEGPEKEGLIAQARLESPRFVEMCLNNPFCGL